VTAAAHALSHDTTTTTTPASAPSPSTGAADETTSTHLNSWVPSTRTVPRRLLLRSTARARTTARPRRRSTLVQGRTTSQSAPSYRAVVRPDLPLPPRRDQLTRYLLRPRRYVHHQRRALGDDGLATTVSATSETFAGTVDPNGARRPTTSSTARPRPSENRPPYRRGRGDCGRISQRNDHGLKANTTYDYALVATSSLAPPLASPRSSRWQRHPASLSPSDH